MAALLPCTSCYLPDPWDCCAAVRLTAAIDKHNPRLGVYRRKGKDRNSSLVNEENSDYRITFNTLHNENTETFKMSNMIHCLWWCDQTTTLSTDQYFRMIHPSVVSHARRLCSVPHPWLGLRRELPQLPGEPGLERQLLAAGGQLFLGKVTSRSRILLKHHCTFSRSPRSTYPSILKYSNRADTS